MKFFILAVFAVSLGSQAFADHKPWCNYEDFRGKTVIGLGGEAQSPRYLYAKGCEAAIFEARVCSISGHFSNSDKCWAVYEGCGNGRWVDASVSLDVRGFADFMAASYASRGVCSYDGRGGGTGGSGGSGGGGSGSGQGQGQGGGQTGGGQNQDCGTGQDQTPCPPSL